MKIKAKIMKILLAILMSFTVIDISVFAKNESEKPTLSTKLIDVSEFMEEYKASQDLEEPVEETIEETSENTEVIDEVTEVVEEGTEETAVAVEETVAEEVEEPTFEEQLFSYIETLETEEELEYINDSLTKEKWYVLVTEWDNQDAFRRVLIESPEFDINLVDEDYKKPWTVTFASEKWVLEQDENTLILNSDEDVTEGGKLAVLYHLNTDLSETESFEYEGFKAILERAKTEEDAKEVDLSIAESEPLKFTYWTSEEKKNETLESVEEEQEITEELITESVEEIVEEPQTETTEISENHSLPEGEVEPSPEIVDDIVIPHARMMMSPRLLGNGTGSNDTQIEIRDFDIEVFYGGKWESGNAEIYTMQGGQYNKTTTTDNRFVWTPKSSAKDHRFSFRINYAFGGVGEVGPHNPDDETSEGIMIRIPKQILRDRTGMFADYYEMSIPSKLDVETDFENLDRDINYAYYEDGDDIVIYNFREVTAGENGFIELNYITSKTTFNYVDMGQSDPFKATVTINNNNATVSQNSREIPIYINTNAKVHSIVKRMPTLIKEWNTSWGTKPADADDWYYLIWDLETEIDRDATQPYDLDFTDVTSRIVDSGNGTVEVVGFKFSGESSYHTGAHISNQTLTGKRYDYVLTRHLKADFDPLEEYWIINDVDVNLHPVDDIKPDTQAHSQRKFHYHVPVFRKPTGHFEAFKRADGAWRRFSNHPTWLTYLGMKANEYTRYDLERFQDGDDHDLDIYDNFDYAVWMHGYPYPWTTNNKNVDMLVPENYGKKPVLFRMWDDEVFLDDGADERQLTWEDYEIDTLAYGWRDTKDAVLNDELEYTTVAPTFADNYTFSLDGVSYRQDEVIFYAKYRDNDYVKVATHNLRSGATWFDTTYIESMTSSGDKNLITFKDDIVGYKVEWPSKHYYTKFDTVPNMHLKNSEYVKSIVNSHEDIMLHDYMHANFTDIRDNTVIYETGENDYDYARIIERESNIKKDVTGGTNVVKKKQFRIGWKVEMKETYTIGQGEKHPMIQESGTFYDLLPIGSTLDVKSVTVRNESGYLNQNAYTVEQIANYEDTGRTMLIVKIKEPGNYYYMYYDSIHPWDSIKDYGNDVHNPVAYVTGNENIADGHLNDGGDLTEKDLMSNLEDTGTAKRWLYSEDDYDIQAITAAANGLIKKVKDSTDADYSYDTWTRNNGDYSYRLRYQTSYSSKAKNIVLFDSLENYIVDGNPSDWKGALQSIDLTQVKEKGIEPVVYLSRTENIDLEQYDALSDMDEVLASSDWIKMEDFGDLSEAKAIAIDLRKNTNGVDYVLDYGDAVTVYLYMKAPNGADDVQQQGYPEAYNNIYAHNIVISREGTEIPFYIHQDFTQIRLKVTADLPLHKVNAEDETEAIKGIKFRLRGTSDYQTEVDEILTTNRNGDIIFEDVEKGTYILQEYETTSDWLFDSTEHQVVINNQGELWIDGQNYSGLTFTATNKPRIHGDLTLQKRREGTSAEESAIIEEINSKEVGDTIKIGTRTYTIEEKTPTKAFLNPVRHKITNDFLTGIASRYVRTITFDTLNNLPDYTSWWRGPIDISEAKDGSVLLYSSSSMNHYIVSDDIIEWPEDVSTKFGTGINYIEYWNLNNIDTSNTQNFRRIFFQSNTINGLENISTKSASDLSQMFFRSTITEDVLNNALQKFDTVNVTNMAEMFASVSAKSLDLSSFDTSNVTDMGAMFSGSNKLETIYVSEKWNTANVSIGASGQMFYDTNLPNVTTGNSYSTDVSYAHYNEGGTLTYKEAPEPATFTYGEYWQSLEEKPRTPISDTTFKLSGTSDYGNDVVKILTTDNTGRITFTDIEKGTYELREIKANDDFILNETVWTVVVDESGLVSLVEPEKEENRDRLYQVEQNATAYNVYNEPRYWNFTLRKVDADNNTIWLQGASFSLTGISDLGTEYNLTAESNENGRVVFNRVEKGTYILQETKAPTGVDDTGKIGGTRNYILDDKQYVVHIDNQGEVTIDGLEMNEYGDFVVKNPRAMDGKITIVKKWDDGLTGSEAENRPTPTVHISTTEPEFYRGINVTKIWEGDTAEDRPENITVKIGKEVTQYAITINALEWGSHNGIEGAVYNLKDAESGEILGTGTTGADGKLTFSNLEPKEYILEVVGNVDGPTGYYRDTETGDHIEGVIYKWAPMGNFEVIDLTSGSKNYTNYFDYTDNHYAESDLAGGLPTAGGIGFNADNITTNTIDIMPADEFQGETLYFYKLFDVANSRITDNFTQAIGSIPDDVTSYPALKQYIDRANDGLENIARGLTPDYTLDMSSSSNAITVDRNYVYFVIRENTETDPYGIEQIFPMLLNYNENFTNTNDIYNYLATDPDTWNTTHTQVNSDVTSKKVEEIATSGEWTKSGNTWNYRFDILKDEIKDSILKIWETLVDGYKSIFNNPQDVEGDEVEITNKKILTPDNSEAYAVYDSADGSLTFFRDNYGKYTNKQVDDTKTYYAGIETRRSGSTSENAPWYPNAANIDTVIFDGVIKPISTAYWFAGITMGSSGRLDLNGLDTSNVTDMTGMFSGADIGEIEFGDNFDTSNVIYMNNMFSGTYFNSLDLSDFNTSNVTNMEGMFYYSTNFTTILGLDNFDTSKVISMSKMFSYATMETYITDFSNFNTSNVINMSSMFEMYKPDTKTLDLSGFDTSSVKNMNYMFADHNTYNKLQKIFVSNLWDTSNVTSSTSMFSGASELPNYSSSNPKDKTRAHYGTGGYLTYKQAPATSSIQSSSETMSIKKDKSLLERMGLVWSVNAEGNYDGSETDTTGWIQGWTHFGTGGNVEWAIDPEETLWIRPENGVSTGVMGNISSTKASRMPWYSKRSNIMSVKIKSGTTVEAPVNSSYMFRSIGKTGGVIDLTGLDTSNVTNMSNMFSGSQATILDLSNFDTSNVISMYRMFSDSQATTLDLSNFDTSNVTDMNGMFAASQTKSLDVSSFDTSNVTDMSYMFSNSNANTIDVSSFDTSNVTNMSYMFSQSKVTNLNLNNFDIKNVEFIENIFNGSKIISLYLNDFDITNVPYKDYYLLTILTLEKLAISGLSDINSTDLYGNDWVKIYDKNGNLTLDETEYTASQVMALNESTTPTLSGTWIRKSSPLYAQEFSDLEYISEQGVNENNHWTKVDDKTWTYTFDVFDDEVPYYIWEEILEGYSSDVMYPGYDLFNENGEKIYTITNSKEKDLGKLEISKTVVGKETNEKFDFTITLSGEGIGGTQIFSDVVFQDGVGKIKLGHNETKLIEGLPYGTTYTVEEAVSSNFALSYDEGNTGEVSKIENCTSTPHVSNLNITLTDLSQIEDEKNISVSSSDQIPFVSEYTVTSGGINSIDIQADETMNLVSPFYVFVNDIDVTASVTNSSIANKLISFDLSVNVGDKVEIYTIAELDYNSVSSGTSDPLAATVTTTTQACEIVKTNGSVHATNTYTPPVIPPVSLTLKKTLSGRYDNSGSYDFFVAFSNLDANTSYSLSDGNTFTSNHNGDANIQVSLTKDEQIIFQNIPIGATYQITELDGDYVSSYTVKDNNNLNLISSSSGSNSAKNTELSTQLETADEGEDVVVTFNNELDKRQNISVKKIVNGNAEEMGLTFEVEIEFENLEPNTRYLTSAGALTSDEEGYAIKTFNIKHNEEISFENIPVGATYKVTEYKNVMVASYEANGETGENTEANQNLSTPVITVQEGTDSEIIFTNTHDVRTGNLKLSKTVKGNMANRYQDFEFDIYVGSINGTFTMKGDRFGEVEFVNGKATVSLKHDEEITIEGLPSGETYRVDEHDYTADGYKATYKNRNGTINDTEVSVSVVNSNEAIIPTEVRTYSWIFGVSLIVVAMVLFIKTKQKREG